jgi:hypothetical protein
MEHRCGTRQRVAERVVVLTRSGVVGEATLCEVSVSGGRLRCPFPLRLESTVSIQFGRGRSQDRRARTSIPAEVVRSTEEGFAVEWVEFSPQLIRLICQETSMGTWRSEHAPYARSSSIPDRLFGKSSR